MLHSTFGFYSFSCNIFFVQQTVTLTIFVLLWLIWVIRSSLAPYHTSTSPKNNYTSHSYHHYDEDGLDYKRDKHDYRIEKSRKQTRSSPERRNEVHVETNGSEEEYRSKAQKFVERNKEVIDSGAMFQMQPVVSKAKLRFTIKLTYFCGQFSSIICFYMLCLKGNLRMVFWN